MAETRQALGKPFSSLVSVASAVKCNYKAIKSNPKGRDPFLRLYNGIPRSLFEPMERTSQHISTIISPNYPVAREGTSGSHEFLLTLKKVCFVVRPWLIRQSVLHSFRTEPKWPEPSQKNKHRCKQIF